LSGSWRATVLIGPPEDVSITVDEKRPPGVRPDKFQLSWIRVDAQGMSLNFALRSLVVTLFGLLTFMGSEALALPPPTGIAVTNGGTETYIEGSALNDRSSITSSEGLSFMASNASGVLAPGCDQIDASNASCPVRRDTVYFTGGGDDFVVFSLPYATTVSTYSGTYGGGAQVKSGDDHYVLTRGSMSRARLHGAGGDDVLIAAGDSDSLLGGSGDDRLVGHGSEDRLTGNQGADVLIGGTGDDLIEAVDKRADRSIRCGPGNDVAKIDGNGIDPAPRDCEVVVRHG
jgi:RTX calcium-binding nonapeptide repeat (4 copies)